MRRLAAALLLLLAGAAPPSCPGYSTCPRVDYPRALALNPALRAARAQAASAEAATLRSLAGTVNFQQLVALLGQAIANDASLSVNRRQACTACHAPAGGFATGAAVLARGAGVVPGALPWRAGFRAPQSLAYAAFAPVFAWRAHIQTFAGGNFWDSRATGAITGSPAADQAMAPFTSPFEMALPDPACAVRRLLQAPYGALFAKTWGGAANAITWPAATDVICARANTGGADQTPLALPQAARALVAQSLQQIGTTVAAWEQSPAVSPFSAKFDRVQNGTARFTPAEQLGYTLFTGRAHCASCHESRGAHPLFTGFTSANIGVPRNMADPYFTENAQAPDSYVANPAGGGFSDAGLGAMLAAAPDPAWRARAPQFMGAFQVPTLRNVAPASGQTRSYMHNGYFASLGAVVHFLNTRDVQPGWPAPEFGATVDHARTGNLRLSATEEAAIVAFLRTLSDE